MKDLLEMGLHLPTLSASAEHQALRGAFVATILERPYDSTPRLIFADWLDEQGREMEAFVIRRLATERSLPDRPIRPGKWSVVRRMTEGANGGHRQFHVCWERLTLHVARLTAKFAVLDDGKKIALDTLSACVELI